MLLFYIQSLTRYNGLKSQSGGLTMNSQIYFLGKNGMKKLRNMMANNRERFKILADATTVPRLILPTIKLNFGKRQPERSAAYAICSNKKFRRN
jgi:hypothetical protein